MEYRRSCAIITVLFAAALSGCTDRRFDTRATYRAPTGRFDVVIHATGIVRAGADLADESTADVRIAPLAGGQPIEMRVTLPKGPGAPDVAELLRRGGYDAPRAELDEVNLVVDLALRGPKATLMPGQTKVLTVVEVRFR